jgi:hypothetical protein
MVNRKNTTAAHDIAKRYENERSSQPLSTQQRSSKRERPLNDDVIMSLANAYENQRARQVTEWERVGFQNIYRT